MLIRIINGTFGYRQKDKDGNFSLSVTPKTRLDPPFEVDDQIGNDLVRNGVAEIVDPCPNAEKNEPYPDMSANEKKSEDDVPADNVDDAVEDGVMVPAHLDPEQLKKMTFAEIKSLAKDMGVDTAGCKKKDEYISAITSEEVFVDAGEFPPDLSAEDPV